MVILSSGKKQSEINTHNLNRSVCDIDEVVYFFVQLHGFLNFHDCVEYIDNGESKVDEGPKTKAETSEKSTRLGALLPPLDVDAEAPQPSEKRLKTGTETEIFIRPGDFGLTLLSHRCMTLVCCSRGQLVLAKASLRLTRTVSLSISGMAIVYCILIVFNQFLIVGPFGNYVLRRTNTTIASTRRSFQFS